MAWHRWAVWCEILVSSQQKSAKPTKHDIDSVCAVVRPPISLQGDMCMQKYLTPFPENCVNKRIMIYRLYLAPGFSIHTSTLLSHLSNWFLYILFETTYDIPLLWGPVDFFLFFVSFWIRYNHWLSITLDSYQFNWFLFCFSVHNIRNTTLPSLNRK